MAQDRGPGPLTADDRHELGELLAAYAWCLDTGDVEGFAELFSPDAVMDQAAEGHFVGQEDMRRFVRELSAQPHFRGHQHYSANVRIAGNAERCSVRSYGFGLHRFGNGACALIYLGHYEDVCVKRDGRWLFERRAFRRWEGDVLQNLPPAVSSGGTRD